jgi:hypothetical protein
MKNKTFQQLTALGKTIRFLANFLLIPVLFLYFTGNFELANLLFIIWVISGILVWMVKIK